jgi:hypothetical protein
MNKEEVYNLLDNGWIYVDTNDDHYFRKVILGRLRKRDILYQDKLLFIRKSPRLYKILANIGMDTSIYDAMIILTFRKEGDEIRLNLYSLKIADTLDNISERILNNTRF